MLVQLFLITFSNRQANLLLLVSRVKGVAVPDGFESPRSRFETICIIREVRARRAECAAASHRSTSAESAVSRSCRVIFVGAIGVPKDTKTVAPGAGMRNWSHVFSRHPVVVLNPTGTTIR